MNLNSFLRVLLLSVIALGLAPPGAAAQTAPDTPTRLVLLSKLDGPPLPADLAILEAYGEAFVLARVTDAQLEALPAANIMDRMADRTVVSLISMQFDTQAGEPFIPDNLRAAADDPYFLVQFYGPIKEAWKAGLEKLGLTFLAYWPHYTYMVHMDPALLEKVQAAHAVQWVGRYHPAYRLASDEELAQAETDGDRLAVEVSTFTGVDAAAFRSGVEAAGAIIELFEVRDDGALMARAWASRDRLPALAALRGVFRVEPYSRPQLHNDGATQVMHTRDLWKANRNGLLQDLMGAGQTGGAVDSGLDIKTTTPNILDFYDYTGGVKTSRVVYNQNGAGCGGLCPCTATDDATGGGHGTHVSGTMVGNGYASLAQRGLTGFATAADPSFDYAWAVGQAPEAKIAMIHAGGTSGGICVSAQTDWTTLYNQGARATNNSWGNSTYSYSGNSRTADYVMWTYQDYLLVNSAGNAGPGADTVAQPANAKNILTVGASGNHRSVWDTSQTSSVLTDFSSHGPLGTSGDTRFKPDIVAPGADVLSTRSTAIADATIGLWQNEPGDGGGNGTGTLDYAWSGGTSMSSPQVTGAALIVRDYFQDIQGLGSATPPSAALIKATLVNGAVDMGYGYEANTTAYPYGGRNMQGWGMANLEQALTPRAPRSFFYDDFTDITNSTRQSTMGMNSNGDYVQYTVSVVDSSEPLKITVTWTDFANTSTSTYAQNNLDLLATAPNGTTVYRGNNFSGSWSQSGTTVAFDTLNNTEAVYLQAPATGTWTIRVTMTDTGITGTQPFALVVSGGLGVTPTWTRTCSGTAGTCANARGGTSAQPYYPSLKPLEGTKEHVPAGGTFQTSMRVTNWGSNADTISLSAAATTLTGAAASGFTITFSPAGPLSLASGAHQDVAVAYAIGSGVTNGPYDISLTAASAGTGGRKDVRVIGLNVQPDTDISNSGRLGTGVVSLAGSAQVSPSFWTCPGDADNLWVAYLTTEAHTGSPAEVWAARSTDGGVSWTKWQVDANDAYTYFPPAIAGSADCNSVTVAWAQERNASNYYLYSRTYSSGEWGLVGQRDSITNNSSAAMNDVAVIYDGDTSTAPDIVLVWWYYTGTSSSTGLRYAVNNNGAWGSAANLVVGANHRYPALTLDTNNRVWVAWSYSGTSRDIYVKYFDGSTNAWNATNSSVGVAATSNRENHPAIFYANNKLWLAWNRYTDYSNATPVLYYSYTTSTLPTLAWAAAQGPYGTRLAEHTPPSITGDASYSYIAYLTYDQTFAAATASFFRGANIYVLRTPAAGGSPNATYQLTSTVDDPPLYARGNAGTPQLRWATTTVNNTTVTGPTLLYSKNPPGNNAPDYSANLGVSQALYNLEENFDLYLAQLGVTPTAITLAAMAATGQADAVEVTWDTVSEVANAGFNLYRDISDSGAGVKLNEDLIPSQGSGSPEGYHYVYLDSADLAPNTTYWYWLEDVSTSGIATRHEPISVLYEGEPTAVGLAAFGGARAAGPALIGLAALAALALAGAVRRRRA